MLPPSDLVVTDKESSEQNLLEGAVIAVNIRQASAAEALGQGLKDLKQINGTGQQNAQQAGFRAEVHHEATFNADAIRKGVKVRAVRPKGNGPADLQLKVDQQIVGEVQVKNCKTVARTTAAISETKYDGMQKVVPSDQAAGVRRVAGKRGVDGLGERNYADTSQTAAAQVEQGGAVSKPLTYDDAQSKNLGRTMLTGEVGSAAKSGAQGAAIIGGAVSAVTNISAVWKGDKKPLEAAGDLVKDTAVAAGTGAASAAATTLLTTGLAGSAYKVVASASKNGLPGAAVTVGIEIGKDLMAMSKGELSGGQVAGRGVEHALGGAGAWGGAAGGAALGTLILPGAGTLVGGVIGGMGGNAGVRAAIGGIKKAYKRWDWLGLS
jgi:hypothetical protein